MTSYKNADPRPPIMAGHPPPPEWRIPRDAWDRAPWNRWSFQNIRQILPTAEIARGPDVTPWASDPQDIARITYTAWDGQKASVGDMLNDYTDGFLVTHRGRIVHESYHNAMTEQTVHLAQSVSKSITSTTAGVLIDKGMIDPDAPVTNYLPELAATAWNGARVRHVLDMTTGVKYVEEYEDPNSDIGRTDVAAGWSERPEGADPADWPATLWDQILSLTETEWDHGARFKYRSIETDVLGLMIARASGRSLAAAISEYLWQPMGAAHNASITIDSAGTALADGGISATLRDFARFGQTMLEDGKAGGRQAIPASWVEDVRHGKHGRFDDQSREFMPNGRYRNMFWIEDAARATHLSLGVFGQFVYVSPEREMVAVRLSSWPDFLNIELHSNTIRAINAIARELR